MALRRQSSTLLPDGRWLVAGGVGASGVVASAALRDPAGDTVSALASGLGRVRASHTATVLPEGTVLVLGGFDAKAVVEQAELFDPRTQRFEAGPSERIVGHTEAIHTGRVPGFRHGLPFQTGAALRS